MRRQLLIEKGVRLTGLQREALAGLDICLDVYAGLDQRMRLTSARGGKHGRHSHHYKGHAFDLGCKYLDQDVKRAILDEMKERLGPDFQIIHENVGEEQEHFHVEYDPAHITEYPKL